MYKTYMYLDRHEDSHRKIFNRRKEKVEARRLFKNQASDIRQQGATLEKTGHGFFIHSLVSPKF
jgi:hypothetical protein